MLLWKAAIIHGLENKASKKEEGQSSILQQREILVVYGQRGLDSKRGQRFFHFVLIPFGSKRFIIAQKDCQMSTKWESFADEGLKFM
jgi:hypothetical protein